MKIPVRLSTEDVCAPCVEQTPVVGVDGTTYNLEKLCCPEGAVWIKFGLSDQGHLWTHFREKFAENEYEVSPVFKTTQLSLK